MAEPHAKELHVGAVGLRMAQWDHFDRNTVSIRSSYPLVRNGIGFGLVLELRASFRVFIFLICSLHLADEFHVHRNPILILESHFKTASSLDTFLCAFTGAR